jgi:hypothetical protein
VIIRYYQCATTTFFLLPAWLHQKYTAALSNSPQLPSKQ